MLVADVIRLSLAVNSSTRAAFADCGHCGRSIRRGRNVGLDATCIAHETRASSSSSSLGKVSRGVLKQVVDASSSRRGGEFVVEVQAPPAATVSAASLLEVEEEISVEQREGQIPNPDTGRGRKIDKSPRRIESAVHQLEISLLQLRLLPSSDEFTLKDGDDERMQHSDSDCDASIKREQLPRQKRIWHGVRRRKRTPPRPPWTADDFRHKAKLMLESILAESGENVVLVEDVLNSWLGKITRVELTSLIKDLGFHMKPHLALEVFSWMRKQKGRLKPGHHAHSSIIGMLGRAGMVGEAKEIFDSRKKLDGPESIHLHNAMIGAYVRNGNLKRAWSIYEGLGGGGLAANEVTLNTLLSGMARANLPEYMAQNLFTELMHTGISPDSYTYNTLMLCLSNSSNLKGAAALIEKMRSANKKPDLCTFNTLIKMYGRAGKHKEAMQVLNVLRTGGFEPDVVTYTSLMQMFSNCENFKAAIGQFSEMQRVGCMPDVKTYSLAVNVYARAGLPSEAGRILRQMQEAGFVPSVVTWTSLVQAYSKQGMVEDACSCFAEMQRCGCTPDVKTYSLAVDIYRRAGRPSDAEQTLRHMQEAGFTPDAVTWSFLVKAYSKQGMVEKACSCFEEMQKYGFKPKGCLLNAVMTAYVQAALPIHAATLFRRMQCKGVVPNRACFNTLIYAFSKNGQFEDAKALRVQMIEAGFTPNKLSAHFS